VLEFTAGKAPGSFLFSLVNPSGLPTTKLPLIAGKEDMLSIVTITMGHHLEVTMVFVLPMHPILATAP